MIIVLVALTAGLIGYTATRSPARTQSPASPVGPGSGAATSPATGPENPLSGISGNISYGPTAPVCYVPFENQTDIITPAPSYWSTVKVVLLGERGDEILVPVNWVEVDHCEIDGTFLAHVEPGNYSLNVIDTSTGQTISYLYGTKLPMTVTIEPFRTASVNIDLETGIV